MKKTIHIMMIVMMLLASLTGCTHQQQDEVFVYGDTTSVTL